MNKDIFAKNLQKLRNDQNLSQEKFAKKIGISSAYISILENEKTKKQPSELVIKNILNEFNVNRSWLETGLGEMYREITYQPVQGDGLGQVSAPKSDYDLHGGWKPQTSQKDWSNLGKAHEILISDTLFARALSANIDAFYESLKTREKMGEQNRKLAMLEKKCDDLISRLNEMKQENARLFERLNELEKKLPKKAQAAG